MNQMRITKIKPLTLALFEGTLGLALGVVLAVAVFFESAALQTSLTSNLLQGLIFGLSVSLLTLLLVPAVYFAIGFVVGYLHAWLFNAVARGIKAADVSMVDEPVASPASPLTARQRSLGFGERLPGRPHQTSTIRGRNRGGQIR